MGQPSSRLRIGDRERERALTGLGEHWAAGRLSMEEFEQRTTVVLGARTAEELAVPFQDLPDGLPAPPRGSQPRGRAGALSARSRAAGAVVAGAGVLLTAGAVLQPYRLQELVYALREVAYSLQGLL